MEKRFRGYHKRNAGRVSFLLTTLTTNQYLAYPLEGEGLSLKRYQHLIRHAYVFVVKRNTRGEYMLSIDCGNTRTLTLSVSACDDIQVRYQDDYRTHSHTINRGKALANHVRDTLAHV